MGGLLDKVQPAVKKETRRVTIMTAAGIVVMWIVFAILHAVWPDMVPFDYTVILGGLAGGAIAVLNFFLMGLMVQSATEAADDEAAKAKVKASYSQRLLLQMLWVIAAIVAPCFQFAAGIVPLFLPSFGIKLTGFMKKV
ncbi:MAG: hypothetical protein LUI13_00440 [Lachnospiraceae bacterium]|nr:hypothetical protein [Lachnospiraceae bacterium]